MVEKATVSGGVGLGTLRTREQVTKSLQRDLGGEFSVHDSALDDDRNRRERHADGGDTDGSINVRLVADEPIVRIGFTQVVEHRGELEETKIFLAEQLLEIV